MIYQPDAAGIGEVCFRGANVFLGYYNNKELTQKVFDSEGWFHTGDVGRIDKDGFVFLSGRIKDIIVLDSGKNVYPDELEDYYSSSESIEEIGVFSARLKGKEIAAALIVPSLDIRRNYSATDGADIIRNEVLRLGRDLPSYKKVTDYAIVNDPLPRTTTRKLKKHELRELFYSVKESGDGRRDKHEISATDASLMATEEYRVIAEFAGELSRKSPEVKLAPFLNLEIDLGLDSMKKLDLMCMVERRFRFTFPDEDLVRLETLGDVYAAAMDLISISAASRGFSKRFGHQAAHPCLKASPALSGQERVGHRRAASIAGSRRRQLLVERYRPGRSGHSIQQGRYILRKPSKRNRPFVDSLFVVQRNKKKDFYSWRARFDAASIARFVLRKHDSGEARGRCSRDSQDFDRRS